MGNGNPPAGPFLRSGLPMSKVRSLAKSEQRRIDHLLARELDAVLAAREAIGTTFWSSCLEDLEIAEQRTRIFLVRVGVLLPEVLLD